MPGGTHGTLSFMVRVLVRVRVLVPGGTHGTLSFMVRVLIITTTIIMTMLIIMVNA